VDELLNKIKSGELPEHPTYEDYLEAKSLYEDLNDLRGLLDYLNMLSGDYGYELEVKRRIQE